MTAVAVKAINQADTAYILHSAFGSVRSWHDFLGDCIRNRTSFYGLQLLPIGYERDHRCRRPVYAADQVAAFVREARNRAGLFTAAERIRPFMVEIDTAARKLPARMRHAKRLPPATAHSATPGLTAP